MSGHLERVAAWCEETRLPFELRPDAVWLPNPAAPRYGVLIRDLDGVIEWSMPFPIPALADRVADTRRAIFLLNEWSGSGMWELLADRTVRYVLRSAPNLVTDSAALMRSLRTVLDAGNACVHALVEVMAGREPAEYVRTAIEGLGQVGDASSGPPVTRPAPVELVVPRIIDLDLWSRATPSGVMFLAPDDGPLGLGILFRDAAAGVEIFDRWLTGIGPEDTYELIRVTIAETDVPGQAGFMVIIEVDVDSISETLATRNFDGVDIEVDGLGSVRWGVRTPSEGSLRLAEWKRLLSGSGVYALVPVIDDGDGLEPAYELGLVKRKLVFESGLPPPADVAVTITVERLARWSEQLCTLPPLDVDRAMRALGIAGPVAWRTDSYLLVELPPPGVSRLALWIEHLGPNAGHLGGIEVTPAAPITRGDLDRELGTGADQPPIADGPLVVAYQVGITGAPFSCTVSAYFDDDPTADTAAGAIRLRRDPVDAA